jgi:hypothetical protein
VPSVRLPGVRSSANAAEFFKQLELGGVPLPFEPALAVDAYDAYRAWCLGRAERPCPINDFVTTLCRELGVHRITVRLRVDDQGFEDRGAERAQRRVLLFGSRPLQAERERRWVARGVRAFRQALRGWQWQVNRARGEGYDRHPQHVAECSA